jgi:hypothetical protein
LASPIRPPQPTMQSTEAQRRSNAIWWILGIVAAGIIFMVFCGLMVAGLFIRHLKIKNSGDKVAIETAVGSISVNGGTPHATGLEIYPGAVPSSDNKSASVNLSANDTGIGIATEQYQTKDPIEFVQAWYKKRLGSDFHLETGKDSSMHSNGAVKLNDDDVAFVDDRHNGVRVVALKKTSSGTEITLVRVGKKETQ